jgi:SAM-dependent methyltransferase
MGGQFFSANRLHSKPCHGRVPNGTRVVGVDTDEWIRRGSSFGSVAAEYAEHRPDYPADAVRWCVAPTEREVAGLRVLDLGAGTGKLTAVLIGLGADVTAVDPDQDMLTELRRRLPSARAKHGPAEAIPLPDESVDAVLCGQSMHWFDMSRALPEIARVLVPGGVLGAMWNCDDDRVAWVAGLRDAAEGAAAPTLLRRREGTATFSLDQVSQDLFAPTERAEFPNAQPRTADSLLATMSTHSQLLVMPPDERDRLLGQVRAYLASRPETASGEFELPMITSSLRSVRR